MHLEPSAPRSCISSSSKDFACGMPRNFDTTRLSPEVKLSSDSFHTWPPVSTQCGVRCGAFGDLGQDTLLSLGRVVKPPVEVPMDSRPELFFDEHSLPIEDGSDLAPLTAL